MAKQVSPCLLYTSQAGLLTANINKGGFIVANKVMSLHDAVEKYCLLYTSNVSTGDSVETGAVLVTLN